MTAARVRIRTATLKSNGLRIVCLKNGHERTYDSIMSEMRELLDSMREHSQPAVGFAIVAWSADTMSWATARSYPGSSIPAIMVPDFVRERLMAERINEWSDR